MPEKNRSQKKADNQSCKRKKKKADPTTKPLLGGSSKTMESIRDNFEELRSWPVWRAMVAEFIGTLMLVFIGCGACIGGAWSDLDDPTVLGIALAFGLIVATMIWSFGHVSGGHVNPAVTFGFLVARRITIVRAALYIISQCAGAIVGCGILKGLSPHNSNETFGLTVVWKQITPGQGCGVEIIITFVLVFCVFASVDGRRADLNGSTPLSIGLSVTVCHLFAVRYTGSSMNPARTFGPAVITNKWTNHWVYWVGPIIGGIIGALLYELVFSASASLRNLKHFFTSPVYGQDEDVDEMYDVNPEAKDMKIIKGKLDGEAAV
uniref:Water and ammonia transporting aquaporin n=1 Tax=Lumbricus rubellus TaxID=35632 RepID=C0MP64_LUMRU|nr:water and ammonia transporting aquaporin [Lumbricus rubellus]